jgi:hypothetical protein
MTSILPVVRCKNLTGEWAPPFGGALLCRKSCMSSRTLLCHRCTSRFHPVGIHVPPWIPAPSTTARLVPQPQTDTDFPTLPSFDTHADARLFRPRFQSLLSPASGSCVATRIRSRIGGSRVLVRGKCIASRLRLHPSGFSPTRSTFLRVQDSGTTPLDKRNLHHR